MKNIMFILLCSFGAVSFMTACEDKGSDDTAVEVDAEVSDSGEAGEAGEGGEAGDSGDSADSGEGGASDTGDADAESSED